MREVEGDLAEEGDAQPLGLGAGAAVAEDVRLVAAVGADVGGHVLDEAEDGTRVLTNMSMRLAGVEERDVLRGGDDDGAGDGVLLAQG